MGAEDRLASHLHASTFSSFSLAASDFDQFSFKFRKPPDTVSISFPVSAICFTVVRRSIVDRANRSKPGDNDDSPKCARFTS
jgi:hypothetical protein